MQDGNEKSIFLRIVKASILNVAGFGLATALVSYLAKNTTLGTPIMVLAGIVVFLMLVSLSSLLMFIGFTIKNIPATMQLAGGKSFGEMYKYIMASLAVRLLEAIVFVYYITIIYYLYF
jgi:hypothetical protein